MTRAGRGVLPALGLVVLFALPLLPEILGTRRLVFRDAQITHWPWRRVADAALSAGDVPFVNASASGGQPLLANPNAGLLYPTVLLDRVLPRASAFNLHYLLHVLWAFFGARALARRLGLSGGPAFFSGVAFAFSGMMLSYGSAFMNSVAAASWMPWCAAAALDLVRATDRRRAVRAGAALAIGFGLQLLGGEPAISALTALFAGFLAVGETTAPGDRASRAINLLLGGAAGAPIASLLASALLLPLAAVLPLTYRGQHLYSERAFGASPFALWRMIEWLFPRFDGDPGALGAGAHWQYALQGGELIYVWCVTFGVIPLLAIGAVCLRRDFWTRRAVWLAAGGLLSLLFSLGPALPFWRGLSSLTLLRRLRYPIKFYLVTTLAVALLAGLAVERLKERRAGRGVWLVPAAFAAIYVIAFASAGPAGPLDQAVGPLLAGLAMPPAALLPAIRRSFRGDALFGLAAVAVFILFLFSRGRARGAAMSLGFATMLLALPWGLPLFVSADEKALSRAPKVLSHLEGWGRVYVSPTLPEFNVLSQGTAHPRLLPSVSRLARVQVEELIPATGAPFGIRYVFDADPDGSYGFYNRLCSEAMTASSPAEQSRLLRAFGAGWMLEDDRPPLPSFSAVTGFEVAGRRLLLSKLLDPLPELRWAGLAHRRASLSGALALLRSDAFRADDEIVLPGPSDRDAGGPAPPAAISAATIGPDHARARVQASSAGHLVFSRTYFSAWRARLDRRPVLPLVANARELAVAVPAGDHEVEFEYDRAPFRRGVFLQLAVFLLLLASLPFSATRIRRRTSVRRS